MAYHSYPTLDQWHMRSVPLPLLEGLDLMYHPGLRMFKCTLCKIFILPRSAPTHSANIHWFVMSTHTREQLEADFPNPGWTKPYPMMERGVPLPPIDDLPIVPGFQCSLEDCGYITDSIKTINNHYPSKHRCASEQDYFVSVNITKLVRTNPPTWIVVSGDISPRAPIKSEPRKIEHQEDAKPTVGSPSAPSPTPSPKPEHQTPPQPASPRPLPNAYPTIEQFNTPCVPHPLLAATGAHILHHPGLGLLKCGECALFLLPTQTHNHFRRRHGLHISGTNMARVEEVFPNPQWERPFPELAVGDGFARVQGLAVYDAFQCAYDDCGAICPSVPTVKTHFAVNHPEGAHVGRYLEVRASKFMCRKGTGFVWIPITEDQADAAGDDADEAEDGYDSSSPAPNESDSARLPNILPAPPNKPHSTPVSRPLKASVPRSTRKPAQSATPSSRNVGSTGMSRKRRRADDAEEVPQSRTSVSPRSARLNRPSGVSSAAPIDDLDLGILAAFARQVTAEQDLAVRIGKSHPCFWW